MNTISALALPLSISGGKDSPLLVRGRNTPPQWNQNLFEDMIGELHITNPDQIVICHCNNDVMECNRINGSEIVFSCTECGLRLTLPANIQSVNSLRRYIATTE